LQEYFPEENKLFPEKGTSQVFGKWFTVDEVMEIVQKDIQFYQASGGGVTIAGGEPTSQPDFTLEIIDRCRELEIHTALDTCGYTINQEALRALEAADLLLYDLKIMDPTGHEQNTGVSNARILENLRRMVALKKDIIIRFPLIPGYTDTPENIRAVGSFLTGLGKGTIQEVDLLAYHLGGLTKYEMLGREYPIDKSLRPQSDEYLWEVKQTLAGIIGGACPIYFGGG
jgi:pyruvate formate lyase activating enzyme